MESADEPSLNMTDPVGVGPFMLATAAVKVIAWPLVDVLTDAVSVVVDGLRLTT